MRKYLASFLIVLVLLLALEGGAWFYLAQQHQSYPYFIRWMGGTEIADAQQIGFGEIHPLWGWNSTETALRKKGFATDNNLVVFTHKRQDTLTPLRIFITGGSTSDVFLDSACWPAQLHQLLRLNDQPHIIFAAGVGGFNSAQEYLRLIEIGLDLHPDYHISYSGANETGDFGFVTEYEYDFYRQSLAAAQTTFLLPNLIYVLRQQLFDDQPLQLSPPPTHETAQRFKKNLRLMQGAAQTFGHRHIGILQPLNGVGKFRQANTSTMSLEYLADYNKYYPAMKTFIANHPNEFLDFTALFDTLQEQVYYDDCHILPKFQRLVAQEVYKHLLSDTFATSSSGVLFSTKPLHK